MDLGCWRAYVVCHIQHDDVALHCLLPLQHYDVYQVVLYRCCVVAL